jgi:transcription antitermination factor NusG
MIPVLDSYSCQRSWTLELKNGNPLYEESMLCNSIVNNDSKMISDKTIKYEPAKSVLKYKVGDEVKLTAGDFMSLSKAFFAEIENQYL